MAGPGVKKKMWNWLADVEAARAAAAAAELVEKIDVKPSSVATLEPVVETVVEEPVLAPEPVIEPAVEEPVLAVEEVAEVAEPVVKKKATPKKKKTSKRKTTKKS